ncbi:hypothetical protein TX36_06410 [Salmonella enterica]|nr:hypothetical protein [Salmonella enterica]EBI0514292.1 hypothetical protein [Salmonella enterica subsp. enterica serovar Brunei]MIL02298.1 hypothetical protein [Salmonella enterica subsp. enterica]EAX6331888.1 hypothetical protein [Salmonella enterica]EBP3370085.1 hypothetical protein [Salmonella enterica]
MSKIINLSSKTKEEIISKFASFWDSNDKDKPSTKADRMSERMSAIKIHDLNFSNFKASFRPGWVVVGPVEPDYVDDRMRKYRGRYGQIKND